MINVNTGKFWEARTENMLYGVYAKLDSSKKLHNLQHTEGMQAILPAKDFQLWGTWFDQDRRHRHARIEDMVGERFYKPVRIKRRPLES